MEAMHLATAEAFDAFGLSGGARAAAMETPGVRVTSEWSSGVSGRMVGLCNFRAMSAAAPASRASTKL